LDTERTGFSWYAVADLCRLILHLAPNSPDVWEKMARAQFEVGDVDACERTLISWEESLAAHPPVMDALAGDIAFARGDHPKALRRWNAFLAAKPDDAGTLDRIAWSEESDGLWDDAIATLTKRIEAKKTPGALVWRARLHLRRRNWDAGWKDIQAANAMDPADESVKAWLPRFELVEKYLPEINALDVPPGTRGANKLLDRASFFAKADQNDLALEDDEAAMKAAPDSRRALLQKCATLLALNREDDAAKLNLNILEPKRNFAEGVLIQIGELDAKIEGSPKDLNAALLARAIKCNEVDQYTLSLLDVAAIRKSGSGDPSYAKALTEEAYALQKAGLAEKAMKDLAEATTLDPSNALAWRFRGEAEMLRANYPAAIDFLSRSLVLQEVAPVLLERARCQRATGHVEEANWDIERYRRLQK